MLWPRLRLDEAYQRVKQASLSGGSTVLMLVATDCDALCVCRAEQGAIWRDDNELMHKTSEHARSMSVIHSVEAIQFTARVPVPLDQWRGAGEVLPPLCSTR